MSAAATTPHTTTTVPTQAQQVPAYPFLAHPPPQKKRPTQPLPSPPVRPPCSPSYPRRRSATTSVVSAWVAAVHPGSPAPCSPRRRSSISSTRRSSHGSASIISRRPSVSASTPNPASASFLSFHDTPTSASRQVITPSVKDFKPDLTAVGYTSVFVHFPETPLSATIPLPLYTSNGKVRPPPNFQRTPPRSPSSPAKPAKGLKHFRSLSALKTGKRTRSKTMRGPPSPALRSPVHAHAHAKTSRAQASAAVSASKKSKYAKFRPPPLATELALAQLADGGSIEDHIRRFAEAQAKAGGASELTRDGRLVGVADVWRDGAGGVWRDQDEEWEYAHLLGGDEEWCGSEESWVRFGSPTKPRKVSLVPSENDEPRRGSVSSQDSDLDPRYAMRAEDERDDLAAFGSALAPACARRPGMSVLAIPARTRRTAKHLRKPEFLLDVFPVPEGAVAPHIPVPMPVRPKERKRPAPLTLTPPSPAFKCPTNPSDSAQIRDDFLATSFAPAPSSVPVTGAVSPRGPLAFGSSAPKKTAMKLGMRGLLRAMGGKKSDMQRGTPISAAIQQFARRDTMKVNPKKLRKTAVDLLDKVHEEGRMRMKIEKLMGLKAGTLDNEEHKRRVKTLVMAYLEHGGPPPTDDEAEDPEDEDHAKSGSEPVPTSTQRKKPRSSMTTKPSGSKGPSKPAKKGKKPSVVPSSDDEAADAEAKSSGNARENSAPAPRTKKRVISESSEASESDGSIEPSVKRHRTATPAQDDDARPRASSSSNPKAKAKGAGNDRVEDNVNSESEMSVLDDEPAPRRKKRKGASEGEKTAKPRKRKESTKELSKDEETIKRLKSLVLACGVRKVWAKEFKDLERPSDQIRRLRQILADLGMTGRMSLEQAKAIKVKREFAQELGGSIFHRQFGARLKRLITEDVTEFAQKMESASRRREKKTVAADAAEEAYDDESDVDVTAVQKRRPTARQSIMAFLADEEESD
ncbi:hypothetical protein C8Q80DRAFT_1123598 [Daedaleopsis nitida]|nr:hypothetical protein C8Q80DRAFT_1123598 [Daedaleopsis nitida]